MNSPLVSVLMPVYNREAYLAAAIESVLAQGFSDFEIIVVDDCSKDCSFEIAQRYRSDSRIKIFRNEKNLGQFPNRTRAAELGQGRYLKYLDSDDILYPSSLAIMVDALEKHPDAAVALSHSRPEDEHPYPWKLTPVEAWRKQFLGRGCMSAGPSAAIIRRDAFLKIGGFGQWGALSDIELWYRMAARWPVVLLPPGLVWWRRHGGQEVKDEEILTVYLEQGFAITMNALKSSECPLPDVERCAALMRARQHHARRLLSLAFREKQLASAWQLFKASGLRFGELLNGLKCYQ